MYNYPFTPLQRSHPWNIPRCTCNLPITAWVRYSSAAGPQPKTVLFILTDEDHGVRCLLLTMILASPLFFARLRRPTRRQAEMGIFSVRSWCSRTFGDRTEGGVPNSKVWPLTRKKDQLIQEPRTEMLLMYKWMFVGSMWLYISSLPTFWFQLHTCKLDHVCKRGSINASNKTSKVS